MSRERAREIFGSRLDGVVGAMAHIGTAELGIPTIQAGAGFCMTMRHGADDVEAYVREQHALFQEAGLWHLVGMNLLHAENYRLQEDIALIEQLKPRYATISAAVLPPRSTIARLHDAGIYVGVLCGRSDFLERTWARYGDDLPDFVPLEGVESGGHVGEDDTDTLVERSLPFLLDAGVVVGVGGGIATKERAQVLRAAGAQFLQVGTIAANSVESPASDRYKQECLAATETVVRGATWRHPVRSIVSPFTDQLGELEAAGDKDTFMSTGTGSLPRGLLAGDWERGSFLAGTCVAEINSIRPIAEIVNELFVPWEEVA